MAKRLYISRGSYECCDLDPTPTPGICSRLTQGASRLGERLTSTFSVSCTGRVNCAVVNSRAFPLNWITAPRSLVVSRRILVRSYYQNVGVRYSASRDGYNPTSAILLRSRPVATIRMSLARYKLYRSYKPVFCGHYT